MAHRKPSRCSTAKTLDSRQLRIDIAKPKEQRSRVGVGGGGFGGGDRNRHSAGGHSNRDEYED